jgi:hypothetical protein
MEISGLSDVANWVSEIFLTLLNQRSLHKKSAVYLTVLNFEPTVFLTVLAVNLFLREHHIEYTADSKP